MKSVFTSCVKQKYMFLAISLLLVLLSCISLSAAEPRVVRVGAFNFYPGIFKDTDGVVKGFYVDALADISRRENIKFEYVYGSWSEGLERIKSGEVDVLTSVAFTEERAAFLDYTVTPLLTVWGELYTPLESEIDGIREVRGKKIAVMEGDYNARSFIDLVKKFDIPCEFVSMPGFEDVFRAVAAHKVDAGVVNNTFGAAKQKEYGLRSTGVVFNPFDIFFAVAKDKNRPLLTLLENNLANWRHQAGSPFNKAREKWSHSGGIVNIIPRWLVTALVLVVLSMTVALVFVVVLKRQVRSKTKSIVESADRYKSLSLRQEAILTSVPDIIMETDSNKVYTWANPAGLEFFGADVVGREASYYFEGEQKTFQIVRPLFDKSVDVIYVESMQRRKDGAPRLLAWWSKALVDEQGIVTGVLSTARDITESKLAEQILHSSEERFRLAIEATNDGLWEWDMLTNQELFSNRWCEIIGFAFDDPEFPHCFSSWADRIHPDDYARVMNAKKEHLEKGAAYDVVYRHKHKSGGYRWQNFRGKAIFDDNGKPVKMVGCISDITERKQSEEALRRNAEELRANNIELEQFNRAMVGRELRMIELKQEINELCRRLDEPPRHEP